jgi:RNA polymerase sigma-70 factor, ECF subfamily
MQCFTDEQLIKIYQCNKDELGQIALGFLYERYARQMLNYFYFTLHNDKDKAQDFVHDLFIRIIEKNHTFDSNQIFKTWIYRIASNMCKNDFRNNKVIQKYTNHVIAANAQTVTDNESENVLRKCIKELSQEQRSLIVLRFRLKLTVKEIAEIYDCPEGTVKSRLYYATKELSKSFKE